MSDPWEEIAKSYKVHEESYALTDYLATQSIKPVHAYQLGEARQKFASALKVAAGQVTFDGDVQELLIPSAEVTSGVPVSIYKPSKCAPTPVIFVYFHGGGLVILDRKSYEPALQTIATEAGCIVVNVEYRLLPEPSNGHAPFDDAITVVKWVLSNKETIGGRADSKVGVGGDSAGGQISVSVANDVPGIDFEVLVYPNVDTGLTQPSVEEFINVPLLSKADIQWYIAQMAKALPNHLTDPRVNVVTRTNLASAPPTLVLLAQLDTIRDSGMHYAELLRAAGVRVRIVVIEGVPHCFFSCCGVMKSKCQEAYGHVVNFIQEFQ